MKVDDLEKSSWSCSGAIVRLLFEQEDVRVLASEIRKYWKQKAAGLDTPSSLSNDSSWQQVVRLRELYPKLDPLLKRHPLQWVRFAFLLQRKGFVLSDGFVRAYAQWRSEISDEFGNTRVEWKANDLSGKQPPKWEWLDYFILAPGLDVSLESGIEIELIHSKVEPCEKKEPKTTAEQVGWRAYEIIRDEVIRVVTQKTIRALTTEVDEKRRFLCSLNKKELANALQKKSSLVAQFKVSTISRCLGDFVACSCPRKR